MCCNGDGQVSRFLSLMGRGEEEPRDSVGLRVYTLVGCDY